MGLFRRKPEIRADTGTVQFDDALLKALLGNETVTKEKALQVPTVSGGIDLIANIVASTPVRLYRENNGRAEEVKDDARVFLLNDEPGDTLSANEFWRAMVRDYYLGKGGYAYIHKERGAVKSLHYVDEAQVSIQKNADPIFKDFDILVQGNRYLPFDFVKILRNTRDGAQGIPITEENSTLIEAAYISLVFERNLVKRGGNKKGFLKSENKLEADVMQNLRDAFARLYSNDSAETAIVLNKGIEFQESSSTSVEMQLNENKVTNANEFAKLFHIPATVMEGKAGDADAAGLARLAAIPLMQVIQCALNRDLLLEKEKGTLYWAFDTKELLKGDMASRFAAYKTALDANFMQIDEVRFAEDMPPLGLSWIKLGLQDVLYDPRTKQIYTPNTNQLSVMGQEKIAPGLPDPEEPDTMEPRAGRYIQGEDGKLRGSRPGGGKSLTSGGESGNLKSSKKEGKPTWTGKKAKEPFDYWEMSEDKTGFPRRWKPTGFSQEDLLQEHVRKHAQSVGAKDDKDYVQRAKAFLTSPRGKHGDAFVNKKGDIYRYDYDTHEFAIAKKNGELRTYWNLTASKNAKAADQYWEGQKNEL